MIIVNTIGGNTYKIDTAYQEARRALDRAGTVVVTGTTMQRQRVIIPIASIDSIEEVNNLD